MPNHKPDKLDEYPNFNKQALQFKIERNSIRYVSNYATRTQLLKIVKRQDRGLVVYEQCTVNELKKFATDRGLVVNARRIRKQELMDLLEQADEQTTFHRFIDLPPELREQIYEWYFTEMENMAGVRSQWPKRYPPLLYSCIWIRKEALKVFLEGCRIDIEFDAPSSIWLNYDKMIRTAEQTPTSALMLAKNCPARAHLHLVSKLRIRVRVVQFNRFSPGYYIVNVPMRGEKPADFDKITSVVEPNVRWRPYEIANLESYDETLEDVTNRLKIIASEMTHDRKLQKSDFDWIGDIFEDHALLNRH